MRQKRKENDNEASRREKWNQAFRSHHHRRQVQEGIRRPSGGSEDPERGENPREGKSDRRGPGVPGGREERARAGHHRGGGAGRRSARDRGPELPARALRQARPGCQPAHRGDQRQVVAGRPESGLYLPEPCLGSRSQDQPVRGVPRRGRVAARHLRADGQEGQEGFHPLLPRSGNRPHQRGECALHDEHLLQRNAEGDEGGAGVLVGGQERPAEGSRAVHLELGQHHRPHLGSPVGDAGQGRLPRAPQRPGRWLPCRPVRGLWWLRQATGCHRRQSRVVLQEGSGTGHLAPAGVAHQRSAPPSGEAGDEQLEDRHQPPSPASASRGRGQEEGPDDGHGHRVPFARHPDPGRVVRLRQVRDLHPLRALVVLPGPLEQGEGDSPQRPHPASAGKGR